MSAPVPPVVVFEDAQVDRLFPLTYARAACELRAGAMNLLERLQKNIGDVGGGGRAISGLLVRTGLAEVVRRRISSIPINLPLSAKEGILLINSRWLKLKEPGGKAWELPGVDSAGLSQGTIVWMHLSAELAAQLDLSRLSQPHAFDAVLARTRHISAASATLINYPWDLLEHQRAAILEDFETLAAANEATILPGGTSAGTRRISISPTASKSGPARCWMHKMGRLSCRRIPKSGPTRCSRGRSRSGRTA